MQKIITLLSLFFFSCTYHPPPQITAEPNETLSEWQVLQMAIIEVESNFDSLALNRTSGARGIMQIMPIFVAECNRLQDSIYFTHTDAYNVDGSLYMFNLLNPEKDIKTAIKRHNPRSGRWYQKRVEVAMNKIRTMELIRKKVKK